MKFPNLLKSSHKSKFIFFFLGIGSSIWFLMRVIPKPSRAAYPCMRASAPFMSAFVIYLIGLASTIYIFRKHNRSLLYSRFTLASLFVAIALFSFSSTNESGQVILTDASSFQVNDPIGEAKGIFPGRVVWVMDKDATNENCTNTTGDYWFMGKNTNQEIIDTMLANGIRGIAGQKSLALAWDGVFKYFNMNHGKGEVGYSPGEKIVIKVNFTTLGNGGRHLNNQMNATPQVMFALLKELIGTLKINQADITIGDPYRGMPDEAYDLCFGAYPNVHYIEGLGTDGREQTKISTNDVFFTSDNKVSSRLPQIYLDAAYLINLPCLKSHNSAGITIAAKNHQGSVIAPGQNATNQYMGNTLHYDYPIEGGPSQQSLGLYRHIVDYMAHNKLGGNTLIYIVDAIWSGRNWDATVEKWQMPPFNNDWTSSIFISQDAVAIESVGFDFLYNEYNSYPDSHDGKNYPIVAGVEDYIMQAADPSKWPAGIKYDPGSPDHSSPVGSLGVYEHWNNMNDKQYSRNLGTGTGIELYEYKNTTSVKPSLYNNSKSLLVFPNPVHDIATLKYSLPNNANVQIELISIDGKLSISVANMYQNAGENSFTLIPSKYNISNGTYICRLSAKGKSSTVFTSKILIQK